jgi:tetraacyldisaccharide 4'-kinase
MVVEVARRLAGRGRRPGILSRGYGKAGVMGAESDEARLYGELLGDLPQVAMADRVEGARRLIEAGADVVVMDDGFQHRRLARELDLVLVDVTRPWGLARGPRAFLPRGLLRESPKALRRAGAIVLARTDLVDPEDLGQLEVELEAWALGVPRLLSTHRPVGLRRLGVEHSGSMALEDLAGREVVAVSAIGNPQAFEATLVGLGAKLVDVRRYEDHHEYTRADLVDLAGSATPERRLVVTTAKDAVKLAPLLGGLESAGDLEVWALDIELAITRGVDVLDALLDALPPSRAARERAALHEGLSG